VARLAERAKWICPKYVPEEEKQVERPAVND
jgi:hypothetical protein